MNENLNSLSYGEYQYLKRRVKSKDRIYHIQLYLEIMGSWTIEYGEWYKDGEKAFADLVYK